MDGLVDTEAGLADKADDDFVVEDLEEEEVEEDEG